MPVNLLKLITFGNSRVGVYKTNISTMFDMVKLSIKFVLTISTVKEEEKKSSKSVVKQHPPCLCGFFTKRNINFYKLLLI